MNAIKGLESTIKQQMEENKQLKDQLLQQTQKLQNYKLGSTSVGENEEGRTKINGSMKVSSQVDIDNNSNGLYHLSMPSSKSHSPARKEGQYNPMSPSSEAHSNNPWKQDLASKVQEQGVENSKLKEHLSDYTIKEYQMQNEQNVLEKRIAHMRTKLGSTSVAENEEGRIKINGSMKVSPQVDINNNSNGLYHLSMPSSKSRSPARKDGQYDPMSPSSEARSNNSWKQDLAIKVQEQGVEISKLKKHLSDYTIREYQMQNEKNVLEKRIAHMRTAFVQQQQELVESQSRALSYRQDITEENLQLKFSLQAMQQEQMVFLSSLVPPLSEHNLQPSVMDAQSIIYNLKFLLKQLHEKLILNEEKLKESNCSLPQLPPYSLDVAISNLKKGKTDIVPQSVYSHAQSSAFPSSMGPERMSPPINRFMEF